MANVFKRAALAFGRWTGLNRPGQIDAGRQDAAPVVADFSLIEPVADAMTEPGHPIDEMIDRAIEDGTLDRPEQILPPTDAPGTPQGTPWGDTLAGDAATGEPTAVVVATWSETFAPAEASETTDTVTDSVVVTAEDEIQSAEVAPAAAVAELAPAAEFAPVIEPAPVAEVAPAAAPVAAEAPSAPIEMKPRRAARGPSFTQLYEMISTETNKRTDSTLAVYERLLAATREELESTRRSNKVAWSIGGVMTAVAAMGAVWSAGEVAGTRVELGALKQQVTAASQVVAERDHLRGELLKVTQISAKAEADGLRSRLDQALAVSAERDRLRTELVAVRKEKQEVEGELRLARVATTQPVSDARPATDRTTVSQAPRAAGSERADVWSILLNGND